MTRVDKNIATAVAATPFVLILLAVSYKMFKDQQMTNDMKSVLAQSKVVNMNTLSSYGIVDPVGRLIFPQNSVYFHFDSCCSQQQLPKSSRTFYNAATTTQYDYENWCGFDWVRYFPEHLTQGSFGGGVVKVQGKLYSLAVVNDTKSKKTTIIICPTN